VGFALGIALSDCFANFSNLTRSADAEAGAAKGQGQQKSRSGRGVIGVSWCLHLFLSLGVLTQSGNHACINSSSNVRHSSCLLNTLSGLSHNTKIGIFAFS